eukprot:TRINITY_DN6591_c0_g2_i1.p1 TRINITY_DN6591_c0_g2~~TRINITY_DN6591_c0_g2_i1.p1  ORF type:complete len:1590 (+),score=360.13 TRINITY_DN6591_c0_g2_i1:111-4772(+)
MPYEYGAPELKMSSSVGFEDTAVFFANRVTEELPVLRLLEGAEGSVTGRVIYNCQREGEPMFDSDASLAEYGGDQCSFFFGSKTRDMCATQEADQDRTCEACPYALDIPSGSTAGQNYTCMWNADLTPIRRHHSFAHSLLALEETPLTLKVLWLGMHTDKPRRKTKFCYPSDFNATLMQGRVVAFGPSHNQWTKCDMASTIANAQNHGAKAVVVVAFRRPLGSGKNIHIPVISTDHQKDVAAVVKFFNAGERVPGQAWKTREREVTFTAFAPTPRPETPPPPLPHDPVPTEEPDNTKLFDEVVAVVCVALIVVLLLCIGAKAAWMKQGVLPTGGVSLNLVSTSVSVLFAIVTGVLTFVLTHDAGWRGINRASETGEKNVAFANVRNSENIKSLTEQLVGEMLGESVGGIDDRSHLQVTTGLLEQVDWSTDYMALHRDAVERIEPVVTQSDGSPTRLTRQFMFATEEGYYYESNYMRPERRSLLRLNLADINTAGQSILDSRDGYSHSTFAVTYPHTNDTYAFDRSFYDPTANTYHSANPPGMNILQTHEARAKTAWAMWVDPYQTPVPYKVFPYGPCVINSYRSGTLLLVTAKSLEGVSRWMHSILVNDKTNPVLGNATFVIYADDGTVFATDPDVNEPGGYTTKDYYGFYVDLELGEEGPPSRTNERNGWELYTLENHPNVEVPSLRNKLLADYGSVYHPSRGGIMHVRYDQQEYYRHNGAAVIPTLLHLPFDGTVSDSTENAWDTRPSRQVVFTAGVKGEALAFDGNVTVQVSPYLTTRVPRVAQTRAADANRTEAEWRSTRWYYNLTGTVGDIDDVIFTRTSAQDPSKVRPVMRDRLHMKPYSISMFINPDASMKTRRGILFADGKGADAGALLFSDGQFSLSTLSYGCSTRPLQSKIPAAEWTHLAASIAYDGERTWCMVYLNGILESKAMMALEFTGQYPVSDWVIGAGYVGLMDDVKIHNRTLHAEDARQLYATRNDDAVALPPRRWVAAINGKTKYDQVGARYDGQTIAIMLPEDDITRDAEIVNARVAAAMATARRNAERELERNFGETGLIIAVVVLCAVIVFILFNEHLTKPFAEVSAVMLEASIMRIEHVQPTDSMLSELKVMYSAMGTMVTNLHEYKSYMPQSIFAESDDNAWTTSDLSGSKFSNAVNPLSPLERQFSSGSSGSKNSRSSKNSSSATPKGLRRVVKSTLSLQLTRKKFSMCMVNLSAFLTQTKDYPSDVVADMLTKVLTTVDAVVRKHFGILEYFSGDRYVMSWNAARVFHDHTVEAALAALDLKAELKTMGYVMWGAVVSGSGLLGNAGTVAIRRYSFHSPHYSLCAALLDLSKALGVAPLVSNEAKVRLGLACMVRCVGAVDFSKKGRVQTVYQALRRRDEEGCAEWMYELERANEGPEKDWDAWVQAIISSQWDNATALAEQAAQYDFESVVYKMLAAAHAARSYTVVDLSTPYKGVVPAVSSCSRSKDAVMTDTSMENFPSSASTKALTSMSAGTLEGNEVSAALTAPGHRLAVDGSLTPVTGVSDDDDRGSRSAKRYSKKSIVSSE